MNASSATPIAPQTISTKRLPSARPSRAAAAATAASSSRGFGHSTASAANEITSTAAAAHANTTSGSGRFCAGAQAAVREQAACGYRAVFSAFSNAVRPNEPSRRAVTLPFASTTNSHGSVGRWNACSGGRSPLFVSLST